MSYHTFVPETYRSQSLQNGSSEKHLAEDHETVRARGKQGRKQRRQRG